LPRWKVSLVGQFETRLRHLSISSLHLTFLFLIFSMPNNQILDQFDPSRQTTSGHASERSFPDKKPKVERVWCRPHEIMTFPVKWQRAQRCELHNDKQAP
jgi:hypothetical protein